MMIAVGVALYASALFVGLVELFPTAVRCRGHGISYNISVALFGGTTPFIATALIAGTGSSLAPAFYAMALIGTIGLVGILLVRDQEHQPALVDLRDRGGSAEAGSVARRTTPPTIPPRRIPAAAAQRKVVSVPDLSGQERPDHRRSRHYRAGARRPVRRGGRQHHRVGPSRCQEPAGGAGRRRQGCQVLRLTTSTTSLGWRRAATALADEIGGVDVLVNNAALVIFKQHEEFTIAGVRGPGADQLLCRIRAFTSVLRAHEG